MGDVQVHVAAALADVRARVTSASSDAVAEIEACVSTLHRIVEYCRRVRAERETALRECERHEGADCSAERQRLDTARRVLAGASGVVDQMVSMLHAGRHQIADDAERAAEWLTRMKAHLDPVGTAPDATIASAAHAGESSGGTGTADGQPSHPAQPSSSGSRRGPSVIAGLDMPPDVERVDVSAVPVEADLFEIEPAKGGAGREDMMWAATTFRDAVLPHIARGGTRAELVDADQTAGNSGFRRLSGAWDVYLGDEIPHVTADAAGNIVDVGSGRHRILAAKLAGVRWIPMRVHRQPANR